tara:strand:+ start:97 stop:528 length:432 start_codon:yes stop_codon:yes gene_type:complete
MKKLLLLLLCVPLMFSCGEEEGESNKEKSHNTETANSRIEVDESGEIYLRNISKNEKFEFTVSISFSNCINYVEERKEYGIKSEYQKFYILRPGEREYLGSLCRFNDVYFGISNRWENRYKDCKPCNDTSKITYSVMGELKTE